MDTQRYSTSTVTADGQLVPWLAADGPLAYTPETPPDRDYFFQYTWILPGIFDPKINKRQHYYFGACHRDHAKDPLAFWQAAREKKTNPVILRLGKIDNNNITAPIAIYPFDRGIFGSFFMLIQHGSYQWIEMAEQPFLKDGRVLLYRGVQKARKFKMWQPARGFRESPTWSRYVETQAQVLSDATLSFNSIHDRAKRSETGHINDRSWMTDDIARRNDLNIDKNRPAKSLWEAALQSYSLVKWVAERKFGPNYIKLKTPVDNIRITTFFAGEHEARLVDPARVEIVEAISCSVKTVS